MKNPSHETDPVAGMRIAKHLSRAGICSRRDGEKLIAEGRVCLNGKVLDSPATLVSADDRIEVDGAPVPALERTRLWLFHKQSGKVTTNRDPEGRPTIFTALPDTMPRVMTIGRLDISSQGLLLLTNDGGLARVLELPTTGWLRRYRVRAFGSISQDRLDKLKDGIAVEGVLYGAIDASVERVQGANTWITLALREGKNREIRNVLGALGLEVNRLIRISYGPFQLGDLEPGGVREIRSRTLREQLGERLIAAAGANFIAASTPVSRPRGKGDKIAAQNDKNAGKNKAAKPWTKRAEKLTPGQAKAANLTRLTTRLDKPRPAGKTRRKGTK